jgi:hypothetical protein
MRTRARRRQERKRKRGKEERRTGSKLSKQPRTPANPHARNGESVRQLRLAQRTLEERIELSAKARSWKVGNGNAIAHVELVEIVCRDVGRTRTSGGDHSIGKLRNAGGQQSRIDRGRKAGQRTKRAAPGPSFGFRLVRSSLSSASCRMSLYMATALRRKNRQWLGRISSSEREISSAKSWVSTKEI